MSKFGGCGNKIMEIISRLDADIAGLKYFFTGDPCLRGHVSKRFVDKRHCYECHLSCARKRYAENLEQEHARGKKYRTCNPEKAAATSRAWAVANPDKRRATHKKAGKKRRARPHENLNNRLRCGIWHSLSGRKNRRSWQSLVGYTTNELVAHIARQFKGSMSWNNMGKWHIDHIIPLSSFSFTSPDDAEFKAAWALTNLRPLWALKNMSKGAKREFLL